jgi:hypothetical protein
MLVLVKPRLEQWPERYRLLGPLERNLLRARREPVFFAQVDHKHSAEPIPLVSREQLGEVGEGAGVRRDEHPFKVQHAPVQLGLGLLLPEPDLDLVCHAATEATGRQDDMVVLVRQRERCTMECGRVVLCCVVLCCVVLCCVVLCCVVL